MKIEKYTKKNGETAYRFRVYVGKVDGKDRYMKRAGFVTKTEARNALLSLQDEIDNPPTAKTVTFDRVAKEWLDEYYNTVQESTYIKTQRMLKNHILPALGSMTLEQLTPLLLHEQMKVWVNRLKNGRKHKGLISNIFKFAIRKGYTTTNPMDSVTVVAVRRTEDVETDFYDKEELKTFLAIVQATEDKRWIAYFRLLAFTGIRKGEIGALDWKDLVPKNLDSLCQ